MSKLTAKRPTIKVKTATTTVIQNGSSGGAWGTITGTLSSQTDLQTALNSKENIDKTQSKIQRGGANPDDETFFVGDIGNGADGTQHFNDLFESKIRDVRIITEPDAAGIFGVIRKQAGSQLEGFLGGESGQSGNPIFRVNSSPNGTCRFEEGDGYGENDVGLFRPARYTGVLQIGRQLLPYENPVVFTADKTLVRQPNFNGQPNFYELASELFTYTFSPNGLNLGSNLVVNGSFATDTSWTKGAGWVISSGVASANVVYTQTLAGRGTTTNTIYNVYKEPNQLDTAWTWNGSAYTEIVGQSGSNLTQNIPSIVAGRTYRVIFTLTQTAGWLEVGIGEQKLRRIEDDTTTTFTLYITAPTGGSVPTTLIFKKSNKFNGTIDNVQLAECLDWVPSQRLYQGYQHTTGLTNPLQLNSAVIATNRYLVCFTLGGLIENDGALTGGVAMSLGGTATGSYTTKNTYFVEAVATNTITTNSLAFTPTADFNGFIQSISVKQITNKGLDATKIGAGLISNTEFGYLDGATSNLQNQLNTKANLAGATFTGAISATNLSGTNTGDQATITGNAGTATALQTPRNINGVAFDGTTNITIPTTGTTNLTYTANPANGLVNSDTGTDATIPATDITNAGLFLPAEKTKLTGIATGATANATDAQLRDRATHTGLQAISTITSLQTSLDGKEPTITTGTSSQYYRGDKTFQTLDKTSVGLANVDNTTDLNKPVSTATQTALNNKQATLVSGTNIKTINGVSLVGAGDVVVGGATKGTGSINFGLGGLEYNTQTTIVDINVQTNSYVDVRLTPSSDHTLDEIMIENIYLVVDNITPNTSFSVQAYAPTGTNGTYNLQYSIT